MFELGFNGFGLPHAQFGIVAGILTSLSPNIYCANDLSGSTCVSNITCLETLTNMTNYVLVISFDPSLEFYIQLPITLFMREVDNTC